MQGSKQPLMPSKFSSINAQSKPPFNILVVKDKKSHIFQPVIAMPFCAWLYEVVKKKVFLGKLSPRNYLMGASCSSRFYEHFDRNHIK